jgi:hypothetical protein
MMFAGQLIVQLDTVVETVVCEVDVLSAACSSFVALDTVAVFEMVVPLAVPPSTWNDSEKTAVSCGWRVAMVQLMVPEPAPDAGVTQSNVGPEF